MDNERCVTIVHDCSNTNCFFVGIIFRYGDRLRFNSLRHNHIFLEKVKTGRSFLVVVKALIRNHRMRTISLLEGSVCDHNLGTEKDQCRSIDLERDVEKYMFVIYNKHSTRYINNRIGLLSDYSSIFPSFLPLN